MSQLATQHCTPCTGATPKLSEAEIQRLLADVPGYQYLREQQTIERKYTFKNFYQAMAFANAVAWVAHAEDHHPELIILFNSVTVRYMTHAIQGLSANDFVCAAKVNRLLETEPHDAAACSLSSHE